MNAADKLQIRLKHLYACKEALIWCEGKSFKEAWDTCPNDVWMNWLILKLFVKGWLSENFYETTKSLYYFGEKGLSMSEEEQDLSNVAFHCEDDMRKHLSFNVLSKAMSKIKV
jgi:hypothetical protein